MSNESKRAVPSAATPKEREWRGILARWKASGLKGRPFCKRAGIQESAFFHWKRELRLRDQRRQAGAVQFVPVNIPKSVGFFEETV